MDNKSDNMGQQLSMDELEKVTGGSEIYGLEGRGGEVRICPECGENAVQTPVMGGFYKCQACGVTYNPGLSFR